MALEIDLIQKERHQQIMYQALTYRFVRIRELADAFGVHEMTIRRDLDSLAEEGLLERVRGGARIRLPASAELSYQLRATQNTEAKARIAREALSLISEEDTIAIDASTTGLTLARILGSRAAIAIVTGLDAAEVLASEGKPFILTGGVFHPPARSFVGLPDNSSLSRLHPDKVFFSAKGFSVRAGFTDAYLPEVEAKLRLIESAAVVVTMIDHSKFGQESFGTIVMPSQVDILITDKNPAPPFREALETAGTRLLIAERTQQDSTDTACNGEIKAKKGT